MNGTSAGRRTQQGHAVRAGRRDPVGSRLPAANRSQGPDRRRPANNVEFFFLRPKDIAVYVGSGQLDLGITGRDLAQESDAPVRERLALGFGSSTFRYAAPAGRRWRVEDLEGKRIATAFPHLVRKDLAARGIEATVIRLDGAVEISVQLGVADAIADVVGSGRTLGLHDLVAFGRTAVRFGGRPHRA